MSDILTDERFSELMELYDNNGSHSRAIRAVAEAAMAMEREECARVAEAFTEVPEVICSDVPIEIAEVIRKRGEAK